MKTLTELANEYIATLPTEERFAALRGFFAGAEELLQNLYKRGFVEDHYDIRQLFEEIETFKAGDYRQSSQLVANTPQRSVIEAGLVPFDAWHRL